MTQAIAKLIREIAEAGNKDTDFCNNYSGRGMYGRECVGITGSQSDCRVIIAEVIKQAHARADAAALVFDDVVDAVLDYGQDSMGFDVIIYWPHINPVEESDSENDGQPDEAQEWHDFDPDC
jgi:hypothetical protein